MEDFLLRVTQQAMNYAIRSGITITATYAIRQSSRLLKNVGGVEREELLALQERLHSKIKVISPAIDMIELISARGNTSLESAVTLTQSLRFEIQSLAARLERAATAEETARSSSVSSKIRAANEIEIKRIIQDIKKVLDRIEDAVPLMNLAITTSGASLSTTLPPTVSPSRLLQASTFLTACDTQYSMSPSRAVQAGPTFTLSVYMLFAGNVRPQDEEGIRETTWKEVMHKARVKLRRVPIDALFEPETKSKGRSRLPANARADEFAYQITIVEDLDDGRVHSFDNDQQQPQSYDGVEMAGLREIIPIHQISKIFYADTGKILNIGSDGETNTPVLLLKRDVNAIPPRRMMERDEVGYGEFNELHEDDADDEIQSLLDAQLNGVGPTATEVDYFQSLSERRIPAQWRLPPGLDPEWVALEVYHEDQEEDTDSDTEPAVSPKDSRTDSVDPQGMANLSLEERSRSRPITSPPPPTSVNSRDVTTSNSTVTNPLFNNIRTSLSLLETLLRLTSLQQFQQQSHLSITDELLNFFLEESSSTGAGGDEQHRRRIRAEARRKVGWDPYDESPLKRRGEDYQYHYGGGSNYSPGPEDRDRYIDSVGDGNHLYSSGRGAGGGLQIRSRENTPDIMSSPGLPSVRPDEVRRTSSASRRAFSQLYGSDPATARRQQGSPLSRHPTADLKDEGIGTSPAFVGTHGTKTLNTDAEAKTPSRSGR